MKRSLVFVLAGVFLAIGTYSFYAKNRPRVHRDAVNPSVASAQSKRAQVYQTLISGKRASSPTGIIAAPPVRKRPWDPAFLGTLKNAVPGDPVRFELLNGEFASGQARYLRRTNDELIYISGDLGLPEKGRFFFQKQTTPGVAGNYVGVVTLANKGYRIEPTGPEQAPELVQRELDELLCRGLPELAGSSPKQAAEIPPLNPGDYPNLPIPVYQNGVIVLESLHGSKPVIYLDFQGGYTASWGGVNYDRPNVSNAQIRDVWQRVAEDFMPFNINVTTDLGVFESAPDNGRQRVIITPTRTVASEAGGVAMIGSFNWSADTPCWVFTLSGKGCAEACSHEIGHTLGLLHEGQEYGGELFEYYSGHGTGETSWAPIMGLPYYANVTQWSKGDYIYPDNLQDQLAIITTQNNHVNYRPDDTGDTLATSRFLDLYDDDTAYAQGVIERTMDTDAFRFTTTGGEVFLRADPVGASPNLALAVSLYDQDDTLVLMNNPQVTLGASLDLNVPAGTYTFRVTGAGRNSPLTNGFSPYASLGYYSVTGFVANARLPNRFNVVEHATNGTFVGAVTVSNTNDSYRFNISSGNVGNTFTIDNSGILTVSNNALLDYHTLAQSSQFPVQFELFVDIVDTTDPLLSETNRRVVVAVFYIPVPPSIQLQPSDLAAQAGSNPTLLVQAAGDQPMTYQWFFDGAPIVGAASPALSLTDVQANDAGPYLVIITNYLGAVTSVVAHLSVIPSAPIVHQQPEAEATAMGFSASFIVSCGGTDPLSYQWQLNGTNISGATDSSLIIPSLLPGQTGFYRAVVSNELGSVTSQNAPLLIEPIAAWGSHSDGQTSLFPALTNAVQIAAGPAYNLALLRDGTVVGWGATNGAAVPSGLTSVANVAAGGSRALALRSDGTVQSWGAIAKGSPGIPSGISPVVAIAAGGDHSLALRSDGKVFAWGDNHYGQLAVPLLLSNVIAIAAGSNHSLALGADGKVWAWGDNTFGQTQVPTNLPTAVSIAAGAGHSLALLLDGTVAAWGDNRYGQCFVPAGLSGVIAVAAGHFHSLALTRSGTVFAWGAGQTNGSNFPQFGQSMIPQALKTGNVTAIAGGGAHTLAFEGETAPFIIQPPVNCTAYTGHQVFFRVLATGGRPLKYQWQFGGADLPGATGQLLVLAQALTNSAGDYRVIISNAQGAMTSTVATLTLKQAPPSIFLQPQSQLTWIGGQTTLHVAAVGTDPLFYQWRFNGFNLPGATDSVLRLNNIGLNQFGSYSVIVSNALGVISSAKATLTVLQVMAWGAGTNYTGAYNYGQSIVPLGMSEVWRLAGGSYHSLALQDDRRVVAWGTGTGMVSRLEGPFSYGQSSVPAFVSDITAVSAGMYHSLALRADGVVLAWGGNFGQANVPGSLSNVVAIAAANNHSVALKQDGHVVIWASTTSQSLTNVPAQASNLVTVAARSDQTLGVTGDGRVVRWRQGSVQTLFSDVVDVAAGVGHALALKSDGTVVSLDPPYPVPLGLSNLVQIAAGNGFSMALRNDGAVFTWGSAPRPPGGFKNVKAIACGDYHCLAAFGDGSVSICTQPTSRLAALGDPLFLRVAATGVQPVRYQWYFNDGALSNATGQVLKFNSLQSTDAGRYYAVLSNYLGAVTSSVAVISLSPALPPSVPLGPALGQTISSWTTGGDGPWFGQTNVTFAGLATAQTGMIGDRQQTWLETYISGPGSLSFWWKVSSEQFFDLLSLSLDNTTLATISGQVDWQNANFSIPSGVHRLRWDYVKDPSTSLGVDAGWLAQVAYIPDVPELISPPLGQTVSMGDRVELSVLAVGTPPLTLQWWKDGVPLPGATLSSLIISNATRRSSGLYQVVASNLTGTATSSFASVVVRVPQHLKTLGMGPGGFQLLSADADGGPLLPVDVPAFTAQVTTDLFNWTTLSNTLLLTNGSLLLTDPSEVSNYSRFYRVLELRP